MARHLLLEAPPTAQYPLIDPSHLQHGIPDLGVTALGAAVRADLLADNAIYFHHTGAPDLAAEAQTKAEEGYREVSQTLQKVRDQINQAPDSQLAEDYLRPFLYRSFVRAREQGANHPTMLRWLADSESGATDGQLYGFVADHLESLTQSRRQPEEIKMIEQVRADYIAGVEMAVATGRYDPYALHTIQKARNAGILIGDVWDTHIIGRVGYRMWGKDFIVVGQRVYADGAAEKEMKETIIHELDHLQFPNAATESHWRNEARAEHNAQCIMQGQWGEYDPANRANDPGIYKDERRLEHMILNYGIRKIPVELATQAHTSTKNGSARLRFERAVAESWAPDMLAWVDERVEAVAGTLESNGYSARTYVSKAAEIVGREVLRMAQIRRGHGRHARIE